MLIIGHRGAAGLAAENTISSLKLAEAENVDMVEVDLRRAKDGQIVLSHNRLKNGATGLVSLDELLTLSDVPLNLEIKEGGFEAELLKKIKTFSHKVLISSFQPGILKKIRALDENIPLGLIIGPKMAAFLPIVLRFVRSLNLYSVHPDRSIVTAKSLNTLKAMNVQVYPWTVNKLEEFETLKSLGIDGVFTDYPNLIKK